MPTLRLFGASTLALDDGVDIALAAREAALLAWLHLEGPTARARLAALLWPSGDEARGRTNLRQTLARLRRAAGEVLAEDDGVLALASDVRVLPAEGGELLAGLQFDDADELAEWLAARRDDARRARQRAALAAAQQCLAAGDPDGALAQADALLAQEPESEQAWRIRMEALYLAGDRAAAIAAWDECREALRRAFGVAPSEATNELGRLIMDSAGAGAVGRAVLPAALRRPPQLIGRDAVLAEVERCLQLRHAVVIAGPGGIGKSRLVAHVLQAHEPALLVAARAGDRVQPGASLARLLAAALKRFAPPLDEATRRDLAVLLPDAGAAPDLQSALEHRRVLGAAARVLQACAQQGLRVLALDDLQFADEASVAALRVLFGAWAAGEDGGQERPLPVPLLALRDAELSDDGRALLAQLADSRRSARVDLAPLGVADLRDLLDTLPREDVAALDLDALAAALHQQVGGNPAFVLESLKSLWLDGVGAWHPGQPLPLPATLMETLRRRLQRLPEAALQVAQLASIAETDFSLGLAAAAIGRPPLALAPVFAELEAAQVFQGQAFSHDLVAEAMRATVPAALVPSLHQLVADHLAALGDRNAPAARVAHHLTQAGAARAAAPWWLRAAEQERSRWQMVEAATSFETAAQALVEAGEDPALQRALGKSPRAAAVQAWRDAARCWSRADRDALGVVALDRADALAQTERERLLNASTRVAVQINAGDLAESVRTAHRLSEALRGDGRTALTGAELGEAARFVCAAVPYGLPVDEALALCAAVQDAVVAEGSTAALVSLQSGIGTALHWDARLREADETLTASLASAGDDVTPSVRIYLGNRLARVRHSLGDLDRALDVGLETLAFAERSHAGVGPRTNLMHILGPMLIGNGRPAAGMEMLHRAVALAQDQVSLSVAADLAVAHLAVGRLDEAERWLARTGLAGTTAFAVHDQVALVARARIAAACGASVDEPVQGLLRLLSERVPIGVSLLLRAALLRWHAPSQAEIDALLAELRTRGMKALLRCASGGAARIALERGDRAAASDLARRAVQLAPHVDIWCEEPAQVWVTAHAVLAACGHQAEARQAKAAGAAWVRGCASQWADEDARRAWLERQPLHAALLSP